MRFPRLGSYPLGRRVGVLPSAPGGPQTALLASRGNTGVESRPGVFGALLVMMSQAEGLPGVALGGAAWLVSLWMVVILKQ